MLVGVAPGFVLIPRHLDVAAGVAEHIVVVLALVDVAGSNFTLTCLAGMAGRLYECLADRFIASDQDRMSIAFVVPIVETLINRAFFDFRDHIITSIALFGINWVDFTLTGIT